MIISGRFTNVNGAYVDLNDDNIPFNEFTTEVSMRMTEREKSQQHGIYPSNTYMGKRLYHCTGDLFADTSATYMQRRLAIMNAVMPRPHLGSKHSGVLDILWDGIAEHLTSECTIDGYPELPLKGGNAARSEFLINFKSFDPRCYGITRTIDIGFLASENFGGRSYNKTYNKTYSLAGVGINDVIITNDGNIETYPVVVFYGQCVDPQLILYRSDGTAHIFRMLGLTIPAGETVTVDFLRRTAVRGNGENLYNYAIDSDWWAIEGAPFTNVVRFAVGSALTGAKAQFTWRSAYMI